MEANSIDNLIQCSVKSGMLYDIAVVVYNLLIKDYTVAKLKSKLWYKYDGVKWKPVEEGPYYDLSKVVLKEYEDYNNNKIQERTTLQQMMTLPTFESDEHENKEMLKQIDKELENLQIILTKLKNVNFKESICKECLYMFYDSQFFMNLDKHEHLVCFRNCTYDIISKKIVESTRDNMLSIYIDIDYNIDTIDIDDNEFEDIIHKYLLFRKNIIKKRRPTNIYRVKLFQ